ncbi:MBL fold metallo-hydrolase [Roseinatronobacter alkalisoli]|uniref:MBL fold metallo-hydrolase n=1 Tax=Roseinatronobacter alkalisoli TaxID=3028235 RepID=A0ABT5T8I9_9RHOB|nr:MBL fold metallo-hydrolase [Roseinatronobacter sp. HJB301]MDD7971301.1 MBL fold metallo-hydrolase [Roseinatronobacter sp. HJB301]
MTQTLPEPDLRLVRAPNPSPMTGHGTNTYIVGTGAVCVIDPGPPDDSHLRAILNTLAPTENVACILLTHSHLDHSPLARKLADVTGARIMAYGDSQAGRSALMQQLAAQQVTGGGEGVDHAFRPDHCLQDMEIIAFGREQIRAVWTPGHMANHMCFAWRGAVFSGDHVMGWASSLVSPPDGDLGAYMRSLDKLAGLGARRLYPGHGAPVDDPGARVQTLRDHRKMREAAIRAHLANGVGTIPDLVSLIYADVPGHLHPAAARNVHAHLIDLWERGHVSADPAPAADARYRLTGTA